MRRKVVKNLPLVPTVLSYSCVTSSTKYIPLLSLSKGSFFDSSSDNLGGQEGVNLIPTSQAFFDQDVKLSDYPTKRMSILLDHESWQNDSEIASPDQGDGSETPTPFADWQKYYTCLLYTSPSPRDS